MQEDQTPYGSQPQFVPHKTKHKVLLILGAIVATLVVVVSVAFLLKTLATTKDTTSQAATLNASQTIEAYAKQGAIASLSEDIYELQPINVNEGRVIFKTEAANFSIDTPTKHTALYTAKDSKNLNNIEATQEQVRTFMKEQGYTPANNTASAMSKDPVFLTFENTATVCQHSSSVGNTDSKLPGYHKLSCVPKEDISKEYAAVNSLLDIYKKDHSSNTITEVIRNTVTEGNKSLATLDLFNDGRQTSLLFAAIDSSWEYIGNLSEGDAGYSNGKFTVSPQIQQAMANPKYGDFLTKNILRK